LADASFGCRLHARLTALFLRAGAQPTARAAALSTLLDRRAAHLLPPASSFGGAALFHPPQRPDTQLLRLCADFASAGRDYERAQGTDSVVVTLVCAVLAQAAMAAADGRATPAQLEALQRVGQGSV